LEFEDLILYRINHIKPNFSNIVYILDNKGTIVDTIALETVLFGHFKGLPIRWKWLFAFETFQNRLVKVGKDSLHSVMSLIIHT